MKLEEFKKHINTMEVESTEFWDFYKVVADRYYTFKNPDEYQKALNMIHMWLDRSCGNWEDQVIVVAKVVEQVFLMREEKKSKTCTGTLAFKDETFHFDIYTSEVEKDKMHDMLIKAHDSISKGNIEVKNKFGKNYFKKKKAP